MYAFVLNIQLFGTSGTIVNTESDTQRTSRSLDGISSVEMLAALAQAEHLHPARVKVLHASHLFDSLAVHQLVGFYPSVVMSATGLQDDNEQRLRQYKRHLMHRADEVWQDYQAPDPA